MDYHIADNCGVNSAERISAIRELERERAEYEAKKDEALFQTAEASVEHMELLKQQLEEVKKQNAQLKENYCLLNELYESAKKEAKANKMFGWVSFAVGTLIGIAGIVLGILL